MMFGVPIVPLALVGMVVILTAVWTTVLLTILMVPIIFVMRLVVQHDDQQFRLLGLRILFRMIHRNRNALFWKSSAYSPLKFEKRK